MLAIFLPLSGQCNPPVEVAGVQPAETKAELSWKDEFERLCAQTEIATSLTNQQIHDLIRDSDALLEKMESVEDPQIRVYLFRLKKCRMFFEFALQVRETS